MIITHARRLLEQAQRMPEAANLIQHLDKLRRLFELELDLIIDAEDFKARALLAWTRGSVGGITLDEITLASIIEASAHLELSHPQRLTLRRDVESVNSRLLAGLRLSGVEP